LKNIYRGTINQMYL